MYIVENVFGSIFWGVVLAIVVTGIVCLMCMLTSRRSVQSTESLLVMAGLLVFNMICCTLVVGGLYARMMVDDISDYAADMVDKATDIALTPADFNELRDQISDEYTNAKPILDLIDANDLVSKVKAGHSIADYISDEVNETIDEYIKNCLLWMLGGIVTAVGAITLIAHNGAAGGWGVNRPRRSAVVQRRTRVSSRRRR